MALDFFDASINRIAAWVIGTRCMLKALLMAMLEPIADMKKLENAGDWTSRLATLEELKTMPFGTVWDMYCLKNDVPVGFDWWVYGDGFDGRVGEIRGKAEVGRDAVGWSIDMCGNCQTSMYQGLFDQSVEGNVRRSVEEQVGFPDYFPPYIADKLVTEQPCRIVDLGKDGFNPLPEFKRFPYCLEQGQYMDFLERGDLQTENTRYADNFTGFGERWEVSAAIVIGQGKHIDPLVRRFHSQYRGEHGIAPAGRQAGVVVQIDAVSHVSGNT